MGFCHAVTGSETSPRKGLYQSRFRDLSVSDENSRRSTESLFPSAGPSLLQYIEDGEDDASTEFGAAIGPRIRCSKSTWYKETWCIEAGALPCVPAAINDTAMAGGCPRGTDSTRIA